MYFEQFCIPPDFWDYYRDSQEEKVPKGEMEVGEDTCPFCLFPLDMCDCLDD